MLRANDIVVPEFTLRPLHTSKMHSNKEDKKRELFDELTDGRWRTSINTPPVSRNQNILKNIWMKMRLLESYQR